MQKFVKVNGVRLCVYHRRGAGEAVVFVHGLTDSGSSWNRIIAKISPYFDVIAYDLRGHGLSDAPDEGYSAAEHASDLAGLLDCMQTHSATLVGHSMGAEICARLAQQAPTRVARLVLVDPPWHLESMRHSRERRDAIIKGWHDWLSQFSRMSFDEALAVARVTNPRWHTEDMRTWAIARLTVRRRALDYLEAERDSWKATLANLSCPTLLIFGDAKRGSAVTAEQIAEARAISSFVETKQISSAGHAIYRDSFEEFASALTEFIRV